jgi:hypothetical protein
MAKQSAGTPLPPLPDVPRNAEGHPDGNPSRETASPPVTLAGRPVSPAVARSRHGAAAGQGHGHSGGDR